VQASYFVLTSFLSWTYICFEQPLYREILFLTTLAAVCFYKDDSKLDAIEIYYHVPQRQLASPNNYCTLQISSCTLTPGSFATSDISLTIASSVSLMVVVSFLFQMVKKAVSITVICIHVGPNRSLALSALTTLLLAVLFSTFCFL